MGVMRIELVFTHLMIIIEIFRNKVNMFGSPLAANLHGLVRPCCANRAVWEQPAVETDFYPLV